jgi:RNA polymerase sigma-70 factor (ECF subfamily)
MGRAKDHEEFLRTTMGAMDLVYTVARRSSRRPEDAEDLVQETYLQAFRAWQDDRRPERVEPWLATICLNLARSRYRRESVRPAELPIDDLDRPTQAIGPEDSAIGSLERETLQKAMWKLNDAQRIAITLVDLVGLSTAEAAKAMGTPRGTVLSRLHRGRRALAEIIGDPPEVRQEG